jgi:fructose-1-phosphate kinase PfkB-like protein
MNQNSWIELEQEQVIDYIENVEGNVVLGIDGFIDQVWQVIETRTGKNEYKLMENMKKFGESIVNRGEGGMANELIKKRRSYGGFTANTGRTLGKLNLSTVMLGMYGKATIDPIFEEFKEACTLISVGDPVVSNILEFSDGKIMMPYLKELLDFNWSSLVDALGHEKLKSIFTSADIVSLGYWSNMPEFDQMITNIYSNYLSENSASENGTLERGPKRMFFDFANIKKRSEEALKETLNVLGALNHKLPMTLSLNEHEASLLFSYYGEKLTSDIVQVGRTAAAIRDRIKLEEIIIHTPHYAVAASASEGIGSVLQEYCDKPVITTGAGDTFNAGYIASCLGKLGIKERLAIANATASYYLKNGFAPDKEKLVEELKRLKRTLSME